MNAPMHATPNADFTCPLCGGPNGCAPAQCGTFETPCWCRSALFPATLLARVPEAQRGVSCICAACVEASLADSSSSPSTVPEGPDRDG